MKLGGGSVKSKEIPAMRPQSSRGVKKDGAQKSSAKMKKGEKRLRIGLTIGILAAIFVAGVPPAFAQPTANNFGVEAASGYKDTYVGVPVNITNVQSGPVTSMIFDIAYDKSVINITNVQNGDLTADWLDPCINNDFPWGTTIALLYDTNALQNGSTGSVVLLNFSVSGDPGETSRLNLTNIQLADTAYKSGRTAPVKNGTFSTLMPTSVFDAGSGTYPSISGTFNGTLKPNQTITVYMLYTYPCPGTGGHSEYVKIWNSTGWNVTTTWDGYKGDWRNISFNKSFSLKANETYNYAIRTGSYPLIHHTNALPTAKGWINCTEFTDANGVVHYDWIPAIKLF